MISQLHKFKGEYWATWIQTFGTEECHPLQHRIASPCRPICIWESALCVASETHLCCTCILALDNDLRPPFAAKRLPQESFPRYGLPIQRAQYCATVASAKYFIWTYSRCQYCTNAEILCMNKLLTNCAVTSCRTSLRTDHQMEKKVGKHKSKHSDPLQSNESAGGKCLDTCCVSFRPLGWFRVWNPIPLPVASLARTTVVSNKVPTCEKTLASETKTDAVSSNVYIWKQQCIIRER